ncbi:MAG: ABC transporter permease [Thermoleophilia bacterium]
MFELTWIRGLLSRRRARLLAVAAGIAVTVALLASIGSFLSASTSQMTRRAIERVSLDWQVEAQPGSNPTAVLDTVKALPGVTRALPVGFADTSGFQATTGGSTQTTGPGVALGIPDGYRQAFPGEIRTLAGSDGGVLVYQQTAANLHVAPGDTVTIARAGQAPTDVRVDGIVDLPAIDSLFQNVGAPAGAQPQAPPDNVILLPAAQWQQLFAPLAQARPELVRNQVHTTLDHRLPASPAAAYVEVSGLARNLETRLVGAGLVGDNLGTALAAARSDASYAQILFLFLGLPGAILAGLLTGSIAAAGAGRRRRDQALLRARGAATGQLVRIALAETAVVAGAGIAGGLAAAVAIGAGSFGSIGFGASPLSAALWAAGAALAGLLVAALAIALPAWRDARTLTVTGALRQVGRSRSPRWLRLGLDLILLAIGGTLFYLTSRNGYKLVLAVEGVPTVSVNYYALLGPLFTWIGAGLLIYRLAYLTLANGRNALTRLLRPLAGQLAGTVSATMSRQRRQLAWAVTLVGLTAIFAASTSIFNATYRQQAEVDAVLTNGAPVVVTESPGVSVGPSGADTIANIPGVRSVEPLQHRFAYVGADLQDLYGVRPDTIVTAGKLQDSYVRGGTVHDLYARLAKQPDGVLVSDETVKDFQLTQGDRLTLRLQDGRTGQYTNVPFTYIGITTEFPTAPSDSFLVANASYIATQTGTDAVGSFLVDATADPARVADRLRTELGTSATVTDINSSRKIIGSSLTAVQLSGLTRVELAFALLLAAAATGLALALGLAERRRSFAITSALGARPRQLVSFIWSEAGFITIAGLLLGTAGAAAITSMLVKVLTGVFDPPPSQLAIPWAYLATTIAVALTAVALAAAGTQRAARRPPLETLRDL